ncbi:MAG: 4-phosphoerythronate dehydrogenase PdxB [bacterium]
MKIVADANIPFVQAAFSQFGELMTLNTHEINHTAVKNADMILVRSETKVSESLLKGSKVRFVGTATIGTDHVDLAYLSRKGIGFANAPGSNANAVAEYVIAALLFIAERNDFVLNGKTMGVVGVGNIGTRVVKMAEALGMQVLLNDPPRARITGEVRFLPLDDLMDADILTLHVPLTRKGQDATFHLFDLNRLNKMKPGSILINTARGGVVDTAALKRGLVQNNLAACVLDVWENEPNIDMELLTLTAIGTPHIAGYSLDGKVNATNMIYQKACRYFNLPITWNANAPSLAPELAKIHITYDNMCAETVIRKRVKQCYDIEQDDSKLRALLSMPQSERAGYFESLRSQYPLRHEFKHTTVILSAPDKSLKGSLQALGFKVA